ncbi:Os01g0299900 [Oryza sativa Japonica Group]|uniref:Os01g0299900 protein n=1 Tax=Oryza sativa subsp. japonica TaxID=39947 RepID=A0A0P0V204_ORYSJ|nr:Os01g0299900 [Oryza sativa Japonica Group]
MAEKRLLLPVALTMTQKHGGGEKVWARPWRSSSRAGDASFVEAIVAQARVFDFRSSLVDLLTVSAARALLILCEQSTPAPLRAAPTPPASVASPPAAMDDDSGLLALPVALPVGSSSSVLCDEAAAPRCSPLLLNLNLPALSPSSSDDVYLLVQLKAAASPLDTEMHRRGGGNEILSGEKEMEENESKKKLSVSMEEMVELLRSSSSNNGDGWIGAQQPSNSSPILVACWLVVVVVVVVG